MFFLFAFNVCVCPSFCLCLLAPPGCTCCFRSVRYQVASPPLPLPSLPLPRPRLPAQHPKTKALTPRFWPAKLNSPCKHRSFESAPASRSLASAAMRFRINLRPSSSKGCRLLFSARCAPRVRLPQALGPASCCPLVACSPASVVATRRPKPVCHPASQMDVKNHPFVIPQESKLTIFPSKSLKSKIAFFFEIFQVGKILVRPPLLQPRPQRVFFFSGR